MARGERMSPVDTTWLRMDRPNNPMVIVGVIKLAGPVDPRELAATLAERLLVYRRFGQKAVRVAGGMSWVDDARFDITRHIHHVRLPGAAGDAELEQFVGELAATPLDHSIPLWQYHIVEGFEGGAAVVVRIHHAIADGIALIGVMLSLTDDLHGLDEPAADWTARSEDGKGDWWSSLFAPLGRVVKMGTKLSARMAKASNHNGGGPAAQALGLVKDGAGIVGELAGLLFMANDSRTPLKGVPHGKKKVAWAEPLPLSEVKTIAHARGCSVNDVLMSCVAGAINAYLAELGEPTHGVEIRALIPVNLRAPGRHRELGNEFGIVTLVLPVGIDEPLARLAEVQKRMDALKRSQQAGVTYGLLAVLGYTPKLAQDALFGILLYRATAVMTNVPGPQMPLKIAGAEISQLMFWVPQSGDIGIGVSILSYNGKVQFGLITDAELVPEPRRVIAHFGPQFERLLYLTLLDYAERAEDLANAEHAAHPKSRHRRRSTTAAATPAAPRSRRKPAATSAPEA
ncbi:wax ester/triacylglycerol synthase family O-acyltransferase [Pinisolibacter sp.]|uniref:wax ester/triacylglycerol synthase family O-acyltransferase n=1 Tax=Pinisolibacter sp. TaxID=2172024 RepID=UPI002FDD408B